MSIKTKVQRCQIQILYPNKVWKHLQNSVPRGNLHAYILREIYTHFVTNDPGLITLGDDEAVTKKTVYVPDKEIDKIIKKRATELKITPAKLLSKLILDPLLIK